MPDDMERLERTNTRLDALLEKVDPLGAYLRKGLWPELVEPVKDVFMRTHSERDAGHAFAIRKAYRPGRSHLEAAVELEAMRRLTKGQWDKAPGIADDALARARLAIYREHGLLRDVAAVDQIRNRRAQRR